VSVSEIRVHASIIHDPCITVTGLQVTCLVICATADQITRDNIKFMGVWRNVHMHVYV